MGTTGNSISADRFAELAVASGLATAKEVSEARRRFPQASAEELASTLVSLGAITEWHREKLLAGKHKGFILGKYKLLKLLDSGGMAHVYLAEHLHMRRQVAIKVLPPRRSASADAVKRFQDEAQAIATLDHPNIVRAFDFDHEGPIHYLVMEYVEGPNLQKLVEDEGPVDPRAAADMIRQAALGLAHAHASGIVHRDIKPANLLWEQRQIIRILDLGLVRIGEPIAAEDGKRSVLGTTDYVAPEQALDSQAIDGRADLYSLGCTLYFLLSGQPPFPEGTIAQRLIMHQSVEPVPLETLRPSLPEDIVALCRGMMCKNPTGRPASADIVALEMAEWLRRSAKSSSSGVSPKPDRTLNKGVVGDPPKEREHPSGQSGPNPLNEDTTVIEAKSPSLGGAADAHAKAVPQARPSHQTPPPQLPPQLPGRGSSPHAVGDEPAKVSTQGGMTAPAIVSNRRSVAQELRDRRRSNRQSTPAWLWLLVLFFLLLTLGLSLRLFEVI